MEQKIINGGKNTRLSELPEFQNGLPFGIVNKTKPDCGGTWIAANCKNNYIIVCPFRDLVDSIAADKNNKYEIFKCYGGVKEDEYRKYTKTHQIQKIAVTYDSFSKLINWLGRKDDWKIVVDEYHLILQQIDFRENAILQLMENLKKFKHYSFLSATPFDRKFEIPLFQDLPHYKVIWDNIQPIKIMPYKSNSVVKAITRLIQEFFKGIYLPDDEGKKTKVESLFIFLNSVTSIEQIARTINLDPNMVKISCAVTQRNRLILGKYHIEAASSEIAPNKKINFFTSKGFQGCNMFTNNGLIIVGSDGNRDNTLIDISTTLEQIAGRLRDNEQYHNIFRKYIIHLYSTNNHVLTDEEFEKIIKEKEDDAHNLLNGWNKMTKEQKKSYSKHLNVETAIISFRDEEMFYNDLKEQFFRAKHELRKQYKDKVSVIMSVNKSSKLKAATDNLVLNEFNITMQKTVTISYEQLLKDYLNNPFECYEKEYPEFKMFRKYLTIQEMDSYRWNKDKMAKAVKDKELLNDAFRKIYKKEIFLSNAELKEELKKEFIQLGIESYKAKATLITKQTICRFTKTSKMIDNKKVNGYQFNDLNYTFNI